MYAPPGRRALALTDIAPRPHLDDWVADALGLDAWHGDTRSVRITVEDDAPSGERRENGDE